MDQLVSCILSNLSSQAADMYDADQIKRVVRIHQNNYPGNWQEWAVDERGPYIAGMLNAAAMKNERTSERIVLLFS